MSKRVIIGIVLDGELIALPLDAASLPRVPDVYGREPEWVEELPDGVKRQGVAAYIRACEAKHRMGGAA